MITRERVLLRAKYGWPTETVPFSRTAIHQPSGYITDAAGYVCMCWDIPPMLPGGLSTVTLASGGWVKEIEVKNLKPGDAIGYCGPDSIDTDGGSIALFEKFIENYALVWQQLPDVSPGPARRARPIDFRRWHAYQFTGIVD